MSYNVSQDLKISQTFSMSLEHIDKINELASRLDKNRSEIVRQAVDLLYDVESDSGAEVGDRSRPDDP